MEEKKGITWNIIMNLDQVLSNVKTKMPGKIKAVRPGLLVMPKKRHIVLLVSWDQDSTVRNYLQP